MSPKVAIGLLGGYLGLLWVVAWWFRREDSAESYFVGRRQSPWWAVAFGMIGTTLSGITFVSVPGWVRDTQWTYYVMVLGYLPGYWLIARILIPLYYRLGSPSIYSFLESFAGPFTRKVGAFFFLASRTVGASLRLFLASAVLYLFVGQAWGISIEVMALLTLFIIWIYTFRSGIRVVVWTDVIQTVFLLIALGGSVAFLWNAIGEGAATWELLYQSGYTKIWDWDWHSPRFSIKLFLAGMFIALVMTGLDQDMMQKNLSCRSTADSQRNVRAFSVMLAAVNIVFLLLGSLLLLYAKRLGIMLPEHSDDIFPLIARDHMPLALGMLFFVGLVAAALSSADSAITALTTSFINDFLPQRWQQRRRRYSVQAAFSGVLLILVAILVRLPNEAVISRLFTWAGYTYGPLLGLFAYGILSKQRPIPDRLAASLALMTPLVTWAIQWASQRWWGYSWGFELLFIAGMLLMGMLWLLRKKDTIEVGEIRLRR